MISLMIRAMLWLITVLVMVGTMLAVTLANLPVLLLTLLHTLLFDRQRFYRLVQNCLSSYGSK